MKRFRLSTLMLLVVIAALAVTVVVQQYRPSRRELMLEGQLQSMRKYTQDLMIQVTECREAKLEMSLEAIRLRSEKTGGVVTPPGKAKEGNE